MSLQVFNLHIIHQRGLWEINYISKVFCVCTLESNLGHNIHTLCKLPSDVKKGKNTLVRISVSLVT